MKIAALAALVTLGSAMVMPAKVEMDDIIEAAVARGHGTEEVFFHLSKSCTDEAKAHKAALIEANGALPIKKLLRVAVHDHLVAFTEKEHAPLMAAAEHAGLKCMSFWITNTVYCKDAPVDFIKKIMGEKSIGIKKVNGNKEYSVIDNVEGATMVCRPLCLCLYLSRPRPLLSSSLSLDQVSIKRTCTNRYTGGEVSGHRRGQL